MDLPQVDPVAKDRQTPDVSDVSPSHVFSADKVECASSFSHECNQCNTIYTLATVGKTLWLTPIQPCSRDDRNLKVVSLSRCSQKKNQNFKVYVREAPTLGVGGGRRYSKKRLRKLKHDMNVHNSKTVDFGKMLSFVFTSWGHAFTAYLINEVSSPSKLASRKVRHCMFIPVIILNSGKKTRSFLCRPTGP